MATPLLSLPLLIFSLVAISTTAHNITAILDGFPEFSVFKGYLTQTKVADEINTRETITVLALDNAAMTALAGNHPLSVIKNELRLHVLLDYFDPQKLHKISDGTILSTTLYQTTGNAPGQLGFVNITDVRGGKVCFGSAVTGYKQDVTYQKSVKEIPYNISVLQISSPIIAPGVLTAPAPSASDLNITGALNKAGCKTFASLLESSGVLKTYESAVKNGLTVFAPNDEAFKAKGVPDLSKLSNADLVSFLLYHAMAGYSPYATLKTTTGEIKTLATNGAGKYGLAVTTSGDQVTLKTGVDSSRVASTVVDETPLVIFTIDNVLLPVELFGASPTPAPAPEPVSSPTPSPATAPSPASEASAPSPIESPPEPPTESPAGSPADAPSGESESSTADNSGVSIYAPTLVKAVLTGFVSVIFSALLF
ncbi:FAS1 domain [Dillenia turbinata]|uniref:FAS1 domain n=1 Tax=Dillenia turbinata TaxID=194707 RepID=A0AAN8UMY1_9MAGN